MGRTEQTPAEAVLDFLAPFLVRSMYWIIWTFSVGLFAWNALKYGIRGLYQPNVKK